MDGVNFVVILRLENQCIKMMKKTVVTTVILAGMLLASFSASAQYKTKDAPENGQNPEV